MQAAYPRKEFTAVFSPAILNDLLPTILYYLPPKDIKNIRQTCRFFNEAKPVKHEMENKKLMKHVAWGEQTEANAILQAAENDPIKLSALLYNKTGVVTEPSGRIIKDVTPFQAALCAEDIATREGEIAMGEMFKAYFEKLPDGIEKMQAQIKEIFPLGIPEQGEPPHIAAQKQKARDFKEQTLNTLVDTISATSPEYVENMLKKKQDNSPLGKAIAAFRKEIEAISFDEKEKVFNPYYLLMALEIYNKRFNGFRSWEQRELFCIQVFGFMQCYLPAGVLQWFACGGDGVRSFKFKQVWNSIAALRIDPISSLSGLGFDYFAARGFALDGALQIAVHTVPDVFRCFQDLCQTKTVGWRTYAVQPASITSQFRNGQ